MLGECQDDKFNNTYWVYHLLYYVLRDFYFLVHRFVRVMNMFYEKSVTVIWTVDDWSNKVETKCEYVPENNNVLDRFQFDIETAGLAAGSRLFLCLRYLTSGLEFWDNNGGENYEFRACRRDKV